jgi:predicted RNA methylase
VSRTLGPGWGYLAGEILAEQEGIAHLDLIEADHHMLEAARANIDDPRAAFHWADVTRFAPEEAYDAIIANPPFHTGRRADPGLGRAFISAAARMLKPSGKFIMVANRHLPYEAALKDAFGTGRLIGELEGYKLYEAAKPRHGAGTRIQGTPQMTLSIQGKTAIITGAANGVGLAIARHFVDRGANVMFADRDEERGWPTNAEISKTTRVRSGISRATCARS